MNLPLPRMIFVYIILPIIICYYSYEPQNNDIPQDNVLFIDSTIFRHDERIVQKR